jgi:hypothetical protein
MRKALSLILIIFFAQILAGCTIPVDKEVVDTAQVLDQEMFVKTTLLPPGNGQIYFGAFPDFGGPEDNVTGGRIVDFEELAGKTIVWACFSNNWIDGITYPKDAIHTIHDQGKIPFVRLMPRSDLEQYHAEKIYSMQNIIDGVFDDQLRAWARDAKQDNVPLLIDFAVEMNGDWFSWNGTYNGKNKMGYGDKDYFDGPERYRNAYRHIIDIFRVENVKHITWFFHPDIHSIPDENWNQAKYYYPGDEYIDWLGVSIYGSQHPGADYWETFNEILADRYQSILDISQNKPIALLEFGVTDNHPSGKKDAWLEDAFETILDNPYLDFQAISYWHESWEEEDDIFASLRIDSSAESLDTFRRYSADPRFISSALFSEAD